MANRKAGGDTHSIRVENWTKWRIYIRGQSDRVIHRGTSDLVNINNSKVMSDEAVLWEIYTVKLQVLKMEF